MLSFEDSIIYRILNYLPSLQDLIRCSRVCKRLRRLIRKTKATEEVEIEFSLDGRFIVSPMAGHVKHFNRVVRDLTIHLWDIEQNNQRSSIVEFMKLKCDENLHKICIVGHMELIPSFVKDIQRFLHNVEVVEFHKRRGSETDEATLLKYCPGVKKLIFGTEIDANKIDAILQQHHQQLTHFYYMNDNGKNLNANVLKSFFQKHNTISFVAWKFCLFDDIAKMKAYKCVRTLCYAENVKHLYLQIGEQLDGNFDGTVRYLKEMCKRDNFKLLELEFVGDKQITLLNSHVKHFMKLKQLTKINLRTVELMKFIPTLSTLVHLKVLDLYDSLFDEDFEDIHIDDLPQIEEVRINESRHFRRIWIGCMVFAGRLTNLKRLLVPVFHHQVIKFDVAELNRIRGKLKNACQLTLFTNHRRHNKTDLRHSLVKLKIVVFDYGSEDDPFQQYRVLSGQ